MVTAASERRRRGRLQAEIDRSDRTENVTWQTAARHCWRSSRQCSAHRRRISPSRRLGTFCPDLRAARSALSDLLRAGGAEVGQIAQVRTQDVGKDGARPDLAGVDHDGEDRVLIEAKFWAGLTKNQPDGYLTRLESAPQPSVLLFVAPVKRIEVLWGRVVSPSVEVGIGRRLGLLQQGGGASERCGGRGSVLDVDQLEEPTRSHGREGFGRGGFACRDRHPPVAGPRRSAGRRGVPAPGAGGTGAAVSTAGTRLQAPRSKT